MAAAKRALRHVHHDSWRQALELRVQHPKATIATLAELHNPPLSKDAYWSRLRRGIHSVPSKGVRTIYR